MKKRILSLLLVAAMAAGMMVGCGKKEDPAPTPSTQQEQESTDAAESSSVVEEVDLDSLPTLNVLFTHAYQYESDTNVIWNEVAKKVGAKIHFITADADKISAMIASGEGYDILMAKAADLLTLAQGGNLVALDDLVSDEVKETIPLYLETSKERYSHDGKLYWLPYGATIGNDYVGDKAPGRAQIRWDLYADLGYPEVKTLLDLPEVLADMVEKSDADYAVALPSEGATMINMITTVGGSALANEPSNSSLSGFNWEDMSYVSVFDAEDGAFWYGCEFYNKCYKLGIFDPDSYAMTEADMKAKISAGQLLYAAFSWQYDAGTPMMSVPFTDDGLGASPTIAKTHGLEKFDWGHAINKKTELLDEAVAYLNLIHTIDGVNMILNGIEGVHWEWVDGKRQYTDYAWELYNSEGHVKWYEEGLWSAESHNMLGLNKRNVLDDGQALLLHDDYQFFVTGLTDVQKEFCEHYGVDYPMQVYEKLAKDAGIPLGGDVDVYVKSFLPSSAGNDEIKAIEGNIFLEAETWVSKLVKADDFEAAKKDCMAALEKIGLSKAEQFYKDNWQAAFDTAAQYK